MIFREEELELLEVWQSADVDWDISIDELVELVKTGATTCPGTCLSRDYCGSNACACIRERFPSGKCYEVYTYLREYYLKHIDEKINHDIFIRAIQREA